MTYQFLVLEVPSEETVLAPGRPVYAMCTAETLHPHYRFNIQHCHKAINLSNFYQFLPWMVKEICLNFYRKSMLILFNHRSPPHVIKGPKINME